jgi:Flp pilus assembly protein TadG
VRRRNDDGSALVEFTFLGVLLLVPLVYVLLCAFALQRASYGLTGAAREAGRAFVQADTSDAAFDDARTAAQVAMLDQGVDPDRVAVDVQCAASPCLTPGARVDVTLRTTVRLPMLPSFVQAARGIPVTSKQTVVVDVYRQAR